MRPYAWLFEKRLEQLRGSLSLRAPQSLLAAQRARASTTVLQGDVRIAAIRTKLTQMGLERSRVQALFHERFIQVRNPATARPCVCAPRTHAPPAGVRNAPVLGRRGVHARRDEAVLVDGHQAVNAHLDATQIW